MIDVKMYTTDYCPFCVRAKHILKKRGIPYEEINVSGDHAKRAWLVQATGQKTVPQIFIGGESIGGSDELWEMDRSGELARRVGLPPTS